MKTVRAVKFGQSSRGNRQFRVPCGCKVEILPAKSGDGLDVHYCDAHSEAPAMLEALTLVRDARVLFGPLEIRVNNVITRARGQA